MEINWVVFALWALTVIGLLSLIYGLFVRSHRSLNVSGITMIVPMLYFLSANNWFRLLALVPVIPFIFSLFIGKKHKTS
jgi:hypothetical protein